MSRRFSEAEQAYLHTSRNLSKRTDSFQIEAQLTLFDLCSVLQTLLQVMCTNVYKQNKVAPRFLDGWTVETASSEAFPLACT